ncbi:putative polyglutamine synthesis accessory protein [Dictyobacter sp. S3.2.2.5]|uniref:Polyglutamine synthesis accessory protein n=1 Tax=Dictyobacter halimunensis TaxID=3026934 RepID=A0ABQ6FY54_9CHLR|nr:putative polyglutamine synthesis accessory protein [Dictyobacter sp. S3.2.2.5]
MSSMPLKLLLVGDVMLGRLVNDALKEKSPIYPWGDTLPLFQAADVRLCNLECAISDKGRPWSATPKVFHFRTDTKNVAVLHAAHIDAVSLANNHILDFEYEGLFDTISSLKQAGIHAVGAGATLREASEPAIWEVQGRKLGFIACTDNEPVWAASLERPGTWYVPTQIQDERARYLFEIVRRTKMNVACLIVSLHWGPNWGDVPPPKHQLFAHALIDAGADVVFGHSSHVVRGIEVYKNRPIIYGAGNFIDDYAVDEVEHNDQSAIFLIELYGATIARLRLYPTIIDYFQARRATTDECRDIITRMQRLCTQLKAVTNWNGQEAYLEVAISSPPDATAPFAP